MKISIVKESLNNETRVAGSPQLVKKLIKKGFQVFVESSAGNKAYFLDDDFSQQGATIVDKKQAYSSDVIFKVNKPTKEEINLLHPGQMILSLLEPYNNDGSLQALASSNVSAVSFELIPRTSRAQSMDVLSSQANIAGYRAVIESTLHFQRFFPVMMTSAGMAKSAKVVILGVGVAGLQAIATARRLGSNVEAFDIRPETREQVYSLGAKFIDLDLGESGAGEGGYAKELSEEGKKKQQLLLSEHLKKADVIITTANIPGKKAPILVTEDTVRGMRSGSVIIDMAAANGGNCPLSQPDKVVNKFGVTIVGHTNYAAMVASDASLFFGNNCLNLLEVFVKTINEKPTLHFDKDDDIINAALVTHEGKLRI